MRRAHVCVLAALFLTGCSTPSQNVYNPDEVGRIHEIQEGRVVAAREVQIEAPDTTSGSTVGGLAGGIGTVLAVGSQLGPLGFLVGSAVGGAIGYLVEDASTDRSGIEYILTLDDGRVVTVVQNSGEDEEPLPPGAAVYLQFSSNYVRVLERPAAAATPRIWINPDEAVPVDGRASAAAKAAPPRAWSNPDTAPPGETAGASAAEAVETTGPAPLPRERPRPRETRPGRESPYGF